MPIVRPVEKVVFQNASARANSHATPSYRSSRTSGKRLTARAPTSKTFSSHGLSGIPSRNKVEALPTRADTA